MIDGMATLTIVVSTMIRETPRLITTKPHHRVLDSLGFAALLGRDRRYPSIVLKLPYVLETL
jgi:hypothetical protein